METLRILIGAGFGGLVLYFGVTTYLGFRKAEGTVWARLLTAAGDSATLLWSRFVMLLAGTIGSIGDIGDAIGDPSIRGYAETVLGNPKIVAGALLAVSIVTVAARKRTL